MESVDPLLLNLISNREDVRDAILLQRFYRPSIKPVKLLQREEELNRAISELEKQHKI